MTKDEILDLFRSTGALLHGHFVLRSGLHSREFFQCAILLQYPRVAEKVCAALADKLKGIACDSIISPALGGLFVGHEVGRALDKRHIFVEKEDSQLVLRRFKIARGERFIVVEDVVTRGGRVQETVDIVRAHNGMVAAIATIVDRSSGDHPDYGCPFISLLEMSVETFAADALPPDLAAIPALKPGSK